MNSFTLLGIIGLLLISAGVLTKNRRHEDILYIIGGIFLELYSVHLRDSIFMILQIIFILSALIDLIRTKKN